MRDGIFSFQKVLARSKMIRINRRAPSLFRIVVLGRKTQVFVLFSSILLFGFIVREIPHIDGPAMYQTTPRQLWRAECTAASIKRYRLRNPLPSAFVICGRVRRFGNAFYQLAQALFIADIFHITSIYVRPKMLLFEYPFVTDTGISIYPSLKVPSVPVISDDFWEIPRSCRPNFREIGKLLARHLVASLPNVTLDRSVLAVHLRAGDVFRNWFGMSLYGQPPCSFYLDVIKNDNHSSVRVFADDSNNPCLGPILKTNNATWVRQSLQEDIALMLSAQRMALARSSFSRSMFYLSPVDKIAYTFGYAWADLGPHYDCIPTEEYQTFVLNYWSNFHNQKGLELVKNAKCDHWAWFNGETRERLIRKNDVHKFKWK
jgi:hypothetical protein